MKRLFSMALVLLAMNVLTVPTMAETENGDETAIGYLSYLNMSEEATVRKFRTVQMEGSRQVSREISHYNLDANGYDSKKAQKTSHFRAFPSWTYIQGTYQRRPLDRKLHYVFDTDSGGVTGGLVFRAKRARSSLLVKSGIYPAVFCL